LNSVQANSTKFKQIQANSSKWTQVKANSSQFESGPAGLATGKGTETGKDTTKLKRTCSANSPEMAAALRL